MKIAFWFAATGLIVAAMFGLSGCQEETENSAEQLTVRITMDGDTLWDFVGDSAVVCGRAWVTNQSYRGEPGVPVSISVSPAIGGIELCDTILRNTTDDEGEVRFRFYSYGISGVAAITASVGSSHYTSRVTVVAFSFEPVVDSAVLTLDADTLWLLPYEEDSVKATLCLYDRFGNLIPYDYCDLGGMPALSATGGRMKPVGGADLNGCAYSWWYPNHEFGEFCITLRACGAHDSACVFVGSLY